LRGGAKSETNKQAKAAPRMTDKIIELPHDFIGPEDQARLESFGAHLIASGLATRWHWNRAHGIDVAFEIYRGGADEQLFCAIRRDRDHDVFYAQGGNAGLRDRGKLEHVMAAVDAAAHAAHGDAPSSA
jgi:hypothetical protein